LTGDDVAIVGDVGGTNCRFALARYSSADSVELSNLAKLNVTEYPTFDSALESYISGLDQKPRLAAFALAGPKFDGAIKMTNLGWIASENELAAQFGFEHVNLSNDFAAMARGAAIMPDHNFTDIIHGTINYNSTVAVLGPGTGLGVAGILSGQSPRILSTEGGFTAFTPRDEIEIEILKWLMTQFDFVAAEDLVSGPGLLNIYKALCHIHGKDAKLSKPREVVSGATANDDKLSRQAVSIFCNALGGFAGNTAHTLAGGLLGLHKIFQCAF